MRMLWIGLAMLILFPAAADVVREPVVEEGTRYDLHSEEISRENGTVTQRVYSRPLRYVDSEGEVQTIETTATRETVEDVYKNTTNTFESTFLPGGELEVRNRNGATFSLAPLQINFDGTIVALQQQGKDASRDSTITSRLEYETAQTYATIFYDIEPGRVKERIVLDRMPEGLGASSQDPKIQLQWNYSASSGQRLFPVHGELILTDAKTETGLDLETDQIAFHIGRTFAEDAGGERIDAVYSVDETAGVLTAEFDMDWFLSTNRVWPITFDPTIQANIMAHMRKGTVSDGSHAFWVQFEMPAKPEYLEIVTSATLYVWSTGRYGDDDVLDVYGTGHDTSWNASTTLSVLNSDYRWDAYFPQSLDTWTVPAVGYTETGLSVGGSQGFAPARSVAWALDQNLSYWTAFFYVPDSGDSTSSTHYTGTTDTISLEYDDGDKYVDFYVQPLNTAAFYEVEPWYIDIVYTEMEEIPDIVGMTTGEADTTLQSTSFILGSLLGSVYHETIAVDKITSQNPVAGERRSTGSAVDYYLSLGPEPSTSVISTGGVSMGGVAIY